MTRAIDWSQEKSERLAEFWETGLSATIIAQMMDTTRGAILGRARRQNLTSRVKQRVTKEEQRIRDRIRSKEKRDKARAERIAAGDPPKCCRRSPDRRPAFTSTVEPFFGTLNIPFASLEPFKDTEPNQCRFMEAADPGPLYLCCGQETPVGKSFCGHHLRVTHAVWERRA